MSRSWRAQWGKKEESGIPGRRVEMSVRRQVAVLLSSARFSPGHKEHRATYVPQARIPSADMQIQIFQTAFGLRYERGLSDRQRQQLVDSNDSVKAWQNRSVAANIPTIACMHIVYAITVEDRTRASNHPASFSARSGGCSCNHRFRSDDGPPAPSWHASACLPCPWSTSTRNAAGMMSSR